MNRSTTAVLFALATLPSAIAAQDVVAPVPLGPPTDVAAWASGSPTAELRVGPEINAENVAAFFDAAFDVQSLRHPIVGAVVSVVYDSEVLFKRGYGWADLEARVPADPDESLFRIASITKPFVWTAIMQLVEQGRVDLDADVNRYLDFEVPATFEEPVRVWHLLSHTPGFEETWTAWGAQDADRVGDLGEALEELLPARVWPPGEHAAYSNYGAALAGYIVQRVSGRPWAEYVEKHVLEPLGMHSTNARVAMRLELRARHAKGYRYQNGEFVPTDYGYFRLTPAGLMSSTAADMAHFMMAHLDRGAFNGARILQESTASLMQSPLFGPHEGLQPPRREQSRLRSYAPSESADRPAQRRRNLCPRQSRIPPGSRTMSFAPQRGDPTSCRSRQQATRCSRPRRTAAWATVFRRSTSVTQSRKPTPECMRRRACERITRLAPETAGSHFT